MPKEHNTYYENDAWEIYQTTKGYYVKDKIQRKYFFATTLSIDAEIRPKLINDTKYRTLDQIYTVVFSLIVVIWLYLLGMYVLSFPVQIKSTGFDPSVFVYLIVWTIFNLAIHETAHSLILLSYDRTINNWGMKWKYIFPAVFVDTSDAYMLSPLRRAFIYGGGLAVNVLSLLVSFWFRFPAVYQLTLFWYMLFNFIPLPLKNDGYHLLQLVFGTDGNKKKQLLLLRILQYVFAMIILFFVVNQVWLAL